MMKGQAHRWYLPALQREAHRKLLREANEILSNDRRQQRAKQRNADDRLIVVKTTPTATTEPRRLTLADLAMLRRQGRVP